MSLLVSAGTSSASRLIQRTNYETPWSTMLRRFMVFFPSLLGECLVSLHFLPCRGGGQFAGNRTWKTKEGSRRDVRFYNKILTILSSSGGIWGKWEQGSSPSVHVGRKQYQETGDYFCYCPFHDITLSRSLCFYVASKLCSQFSGYRNNHKAASEGRDSTPKQFTNYNTHFTKPQPHIFK